MITIALIVMGVASVVGLSLRRKYRRGHGISIIIPARCPDKHSQRAKNLHWVKRYWHAQLPGAEIIVGEDHDMHLPFSKSVAVNEAVSRATGDILVVVDADGYVPAEAVLQCARKIRQAIRKGRRLWYVPYRHFYRLTREASERVIHSCPADPYRFPVPPPRDCIIDMSGSQHGHWYGAGIQIMPREAFEEVGGWDRRFRGWGGEDHAHMRAMDTLYWHHKTLPGQFLHLWHPMKSPTGTHEIVHWRDRMWEGQITSGANDVLSGRYYGAYGDTKRMRKLVDEGRNR